MKDKGAIFKRALFYMIPVLVLLSADQLTKSLAEDLGSGRVKIIPGVFELTYVENRGAAFGILENRQAVFVVLALVFIAAAVWFLFRLPFERKYLILRILDVFMISGALGNLADRLYLGYVRDFLYFRLIDFPVFNLADIYVTGSAFVLCVLLLTKYRDEDFMEVLRRR